MSFSVPLDVKLRIDQAHQAGENVVLVTGVFDLLHEEHRVFLQKAKDVGDFLVVAIESDVRVRQIKGQDRPVWKQGKRLEELKALSMVDVGFVLPEEFSKPEHHEQLISEVRPAILAISSHSPHQDKKKSLVEKYGGMLMIVHQHNPHISTTQMLQATSQ